MHVGTTSCYSVPHEDKHVVLCHLSQFSESTFLDLQGIHEFAAPHDLVWQQVCYPLVDTLDTIQVWILFSSHRDDLCKHVCAFSAYVIARRGGKHAARSHKPDLFRCVNLYRR